MSVSLEKITPECKCFFFKRMNKSHLVPSLVLGSRDLLFRGYDSIITNVDEHYLNVLG